MKHLLFVTDFKNGSHAALEVAIKICRTHPSCNLHVLHVNTQNGAAEHKVPQSSIALIRHQDHINDKMIELRKFVSALGVKPEMAYVEGDLAQTINDYCQLQKIDLIVAGHSNSAQIGDQVLGSNAEKIMQEADVPVLIVPQGSDANHLFHKITFATDYHDSDGAMAEQLLKLMAPFHPQVNFLHICTESLSADEEWKMMEDFQKRMTLRLDYNNLSFQMIHGDNNEDQLIAYIESAAAELLVVATHTGQLLDRMLGASAARTLIQNTQVPLLVFHYRRHFKPRLFF